MRGIDVPAPSADATRQPANAHGSHLGAATEKTASAPAPNAPNSPPSSAYIAARVRWYEAIVHQGVPAVASGRRAAIRARDRTKAMKQPQSLRD